MTIQLSHSFILYSTLGCHLCDLASEVIQRSFNSRAPVIGVVDIAENVQLMEQYALRIPVVVEVNSGKEIGWPFDEQQFLSWYNGL